VQRREQAPQAEVSARLQAKKKKKKKTLHAIKLTWTAAPGHR